MTESLYDIAIIGAGPGGYHAAIRAAQYGAKVALIEKAQLGGTCLNLGCIPTKALYASSNLIEKVNNSEKFGINIPEFTKSFNQAIERKNRVVQELVEGIRSLQKAWNNDIFLGHGKMDSGDITNGFDISIQGEESQRIKAKRVIIATGSSPAFFPDFNIDHEKILTSDDILNPEFNIVPKRLLIIGAGIIGCEFASIFASFGSKVVMLEYLQTPIATEEPQAIKLLQKKFEELGIEIHTSINAISLENTGVEVRATTCSAGIPKDQISCSEKLTFEADYCLVSIGRRKESDGIGLEDLGIKTVRDSIFINSKTTETNIKGIYAIGDVASSGAPMLAHVASYMGDIAVANALSSIGGFPTKKKVADYSVIPSTIFTSPNISSIGYRRDIAKAKGIDLLRGHFHYSSLGKAKCMGEEDGYLLILAEKKTKKIIGASCIGAEAPELIAEIALAMRNGLTIESITETIHCHPTLSEMVLETAEDTVGKAIHKKGRPRFE